MDTRPFLYVDLVKGWRDELHPRDKHGKFSTVKGGSKVVTKQGKTGVVDSVTSTHYHITTEEGKKSKVAKDNAIHLNDHSKVMEANKKEERKKKAVAKKAGAKQSTTKATVKADGKGKAKLLVDPTTTETAVKTAPTKPKKQSRAKEALEAPVLKRAKNQASEAKEVKGTIAGAGKKATPLNVQNNSSSNAPIKEYASAEQDLPSSDKVTIDSMWASSDVQKLMKQKPEKRNPEQIRKLAGNMTEANDLLAKKLASKKASVMGIQIAKNKIGTKSSKTVITEGQETGLYGDMLQSARGAMYETLLATMSGSQNPGEGAPIGAHVVNRMKDKINNDLYGMLNSIPAPHETRPAIRAMKHHETDLAKLLGRTPDHDELALHLQDKSDKFRDAPIAPAPRWDEKTNAWIAGRGQVTDPSERLALLKQYDAIQRTVSADKNVGTAGEKEVSITQNAVAEGRSPEESMIRQERQSELEGALPKAMKAMGMSDSSIKVWSLTHSGTSGGRSQMKSSEVAEMINQQGGHEGKPISESWVRKHYAEGRKVIEEALKDNHPALAQLSMLKSFVFNNMLRNVYEYNLIKSLYSWGLDETIIRDKFERTASGRDLHEIRKSLSPVEYIGSYVTVDSGQVHARIVTHDLPKGEELTKAFQDFEEINKALFSHKDGGNHAVNEKMKAYVQKNSGKYKASSAQQHAQAKAKKGALTWSEELLIKNPGSAWVSWGGKRVLINSATGDVVFDSKNEAHRDEQAENHGITNQEDKMGFHHEDDESEAKSKELKDKANEDHSKGNYGRSQGKWAEKHGVKMKKTKGEDGKDVHELDKDEEGNLQFDHSKHNLVTDHGAQAFEEQLGDLKAHIANHKKSAVEEHHHKAIGMYGKLSPEEQESYDKMSSEEREHFVGQHLGSQEGVKELMEKARQMASEGKKGADIQKELESELKAVAKSTGSMGLGNKKKMISVFNNLKSHASVDDTLRHVGAQEISRGKEEANKRIVPEGHYEIGNKANGKSMVVKIGHRIDPETKNYTTYVQEAFNPKTGEHFTTEDTENSWGQLGSSLGLKHNSAEKFIYESNDSEKGDAVMQAMGDDEAKELRSQTSLGMKDSMLHKDFKMVDQQRGKDGKVKSTTYAQDMPDGTQNVVEVGADGYLKDPIMARLLKSREKIESAEDLHKAMEKAVGNKIWVTAHMGADVHIGDALGHHVQLMYDGKGAPRVVGGAFDGYRFMDSKDIPKGTMDAHTGEPIKALFKNGKLLDRKASVMNDVAIGEGKAVMYKDGNSWKKGKVREVQESGAHQVVDAKGNLVGLFDKKELQPAKEKGRTLSKSGQAVVKIAHDGTHRMSPATAFEDDKQSQKAKALFTEALRKAKITGAVDREGNLNKDLELNDKQHKALEKVLGRSKAGKAIMSRFNTTTMPQLEIHVPEGMRKEVEAEGIAIGKDGTARISAGRFEDIRGILGGLSLDHKAQEYMKDHFKRKDRTPRAVEELKKDYQPSQAVGAHADAFRKQFKEDSFLMNPEQGLYGTQLEGVAHLVERGRGIAGHGMGTGKTILGIMAGLHHKATQQAKGKKAGKTLVVAPKGIMTDWGKEIGSHTNSKALYIGSGFKSSKKHENGRKLWGQDGTEQEAVDMKSFKKNTELHASEDHDFHIVSYDTFMANREHFANSGMYDNIAIDEIHAFKNQGGRRGASLAETTDRFKNVWGLSGTPMENDAREVHSLIDTVTGGKHELGSKKEFQDKFMMKDRKGKLTGVKPEMADVLGDVMANVVQFRGGEDVKYNDGSKIHFPHLAGADATEDNPNPQQDFIGNMVDRNRDHKTTDYYGTKHSIVDFEADEQTVDAGTEGEYKVTTMTPKGVDPNSAMGKMYKTYNELQAKYLPESKLKELKNAVTTGMDGQGAKGNSNYLTAMQKLQKFINAPLAHKMYVPGGGNAIESDATNAQAEAPSDKKGDPIPHEVDADGNKRYYESDGAGGFHKNADGSPKLLPPLHHNNPKAQYLHKRVSKYLDQVGAENAERRKNGKPEIMPKVVIKSAYTTFGTDIVDGVLKDLQKDHPELARWKDKVGDKFGAGRFTGDAGDREETKVGFRGNKKAYASEQGHLWATSVSPAGKEGVDFGNAHMMLHFDQDWNPQKMAQFTARVRRSDSAKSHAQVDRANAVRVESLHMPGTMEDFMFDAQDKKMSSIKQVTKATREAEQAPKLGETQGTVGYGQKGFTRGAKNKAGAKPKGNLVINTSKPKIPSKTGGSRAVGDKRAVAEPLAKSMKLVVRL